MKLLIKLKKYQNSWAEACWSKYYFDDFSKNKDIAILTNNEFYKESPLLSPIYYLKNLWIVNIILKLIK